MSSNRVPTTGPAKFVCRPIHHYTNTCRRPSATGAATSDPRPSFHSLAHAMRWLNKFATLVPLGLLRHAVPSEPQASRLPIEILRIVVTMAVAEHIDYVIRSDGKVKVCLLHRMGYDSNADIMLGQGVKENEGEHCCCASAIVLHSS